MLLQVRTYLLCFPLVITAFAACGGKVVVDHEGTGGKGAGGFTGSSSTSSSSGWTTSSSGTTSSSSGWTTSSSSGWSSSSSSGSTSSSSGGGVCDNAGDCGSCQSCAIEGPCSTEWDDCLNNKDCYGLLECFQGCADDVCFEQCFQKYPNGQDFYYQLAICVVCDACHADCDGQNSGCP